MNVALIVLDAVRADHVSCYGHTRSTTPNLDAFAEATTRYASVVSPGVWTFPSMTSMFTGLYPSQHGMNRADRSVPADLRLLAGRLRDGGYKTGGFSANPYMGRTYGFDRDFDLFREFWGVSGGGANTGVSGAVNGLYQWLFPRVRRTVKRSQRLTAAYQRYLRRKVEGRDKGAAALVDAAVEWVGQARRGRRPFFLYTHLMEAHGPLAPPSEHAARFMDQPSIATARQLDQDAMAYMAGANPLDDQQLNLLRNLYDASISYGDHHLSRLLDALGDDTVIVITADHGNSFGEHGILDHFFSVHQTLASVPLIIRHPNIPPGIIHQPVGTIDITPTILETAGLDTTGLAGLSLSSHGSHGSQGLGVDPRGCLVTEFLDPPLERFQRFHRFDPVGFRRELRGVRRGDHKYIWSSDGHEELYDLHTDPRETINLVDTQPTLLADLRKLHDDWLLEVSSQPTEIRPAPSDFEVEEDVASTLRALGYLD